jgi:serine protease Do
VRCSWVSSYGMVRSFLVLPCLLAFSVPTLVLPVPAFAADMPWNATVIADVAEKVTPAVVNITTRSADPTRALPFEGHPMFREYFGKKQQREQIGAGSGVLISGDGFIVTNNHVIEGAEEIKVTLADKRELRARLIGTDKPTDVALLKIDGKNFPHLGFGNSAELRLGEIVLAIGNPFGVGLTVTMGIVSAKGRSKMGILDVPGAYEDFIQTDAAINPGNSGGALVNLKGELVGINTAILSKSGGSQGIGFAVPSNMVRPIREALLADGRVRRGWLGIGIQDLTPEIARGLELGDVRGVLVNNVMNDGPASRAKLESGDIVTRVNDQPMMNEAELRNTIALMKPGSKVKLTVMREGKKLELTAQLDEKPDPGKRDDPSSPKELTERLLAGLSVTDLEEKMREELGAPPSLVGVVVTAIEPGSTVGDSTLEVGDVIVAVNKQKVRSVGELMKLVPKTSNEAVLRVWRAGQFQFVSLRR